MPNRMRRVIAQMCRQHGVALTVTATLDSVVPLKELAASGKTHTILPPYFLAAEVAAGRLQAARIVDPPITRTVLLASATQGPMGRACAEVAALIREVTARLVQSGALPARLSASALSGEGCGDSIAEPGGTDLAGAEVGATPRRAVRAGRSATRI
jgi:LysR family transcriptional regulator, nitrogen assimilation regulatory protein